MGQIRTPYLEELLATPMMDSGLPPQGRVNLWPPARGTRRSKAVGAIRKQGLMSMRIRLTNPEPSNLRGTQRGMVKVQIEQKVGLLDPAIRRLVLTVPRIMPISPTTAMKISLENPQADKIDLT